MKYSLLNSLSLPSDLKKLSLAEEKELCRELREKIINTVAKNGGHLSSNLGVVELTVALHRVFESPKDKIIFDVGHQSYAHKLLTGRASSFDTLRTAGGISGFMNPKESEHDPVTTGHSSTSISSALGIAQAMKLKGDNHHAIAVIGDGALTGGLSYEGLNNAGRSGANIVVVLNYNEMSISKNIGALAEYLSKLRIRQSYRDVKSTARSIISSVPIVGKKISDSVSYSKGLLRSGILHSTIFEELGFKYIGPVEGHNLTELENALSYAKALSGPVLVQVNTIKGKGYKPAEENAANYHGVSGFDVKTGAIPNKEYSFTDVFSKAIVELADKDRRICAITASMKYGVGLRDFKRKYPERYFDVGIAEGHAVTFAAGLASAGMIPVFSVYSSFLQRSYDQLIHDVAISGVHMVICADHAGIVSSDGVTHQGLFDIPFLTTIPNVTIYSPSCYSEVGRCLEKAAFSDRGIAVVRYPKGCEAKAEETGDSDYLLESRGSDTLIISYGRETEQAYMASKQLECDYMRLLKVFPISDEVIKIISSNSYKRAFVFEECEYEGSIGQKLKALCPNVSAHAIDGFVSHMKVCEALKLYGLTSEDIVTTVERESTDG